MDYEISVLPNHPSQIMLWTGKKFCYHMGIVCVTCPNLFKMGLQLGDMKSLGRTLEVYRMIRIYIYISVQYIDQQIPCFEPLLVLNPCFSIRDSWCNIGDPVQYDQNKHDQNK